MSEEQKLIDHELAREWMKKNWPNCKKVDVFWTMEKYDYPYYVREWIKETWIKESEICGGTYCCK